VNKNGDQAVYFWSFKGMDRITNINTTGEITTALFRTKDVAEVNMLRRAILSEIDTYTIDIVIFQTNTSPRHDEVVALRLGQLVIDHTRFVPPAEGDLTIHIDVRGPLNFTTASIPELPFKYETPIVVLREGHRIVCDCKIKRGQGKTHAKWRPISVFTFTEVEDGFQISFKGIGMMDGTTIIEQGIAKMPDAARRPPITIFSQPLIPYNMQ
ncbi:Hypothetical protein HVR_LOCUS1213, partial [uncultured virus]